MRAFENTAPRGISGPKIHEVTEFKNIMPNQIIIKVIKSLVVHLASIIMFNWKTSRMETIWETKAYPKGEQTLEKQSGKM